MTSRLGLILLCPLRTDGFVRTGGASAVSAGASETIKTFATGTDIATRVVVLATFIHVVADAAAADENYKPLNIDRYFFSFCLLNNIRESG